MKSTLNFSKRDVFKIGFLILLFGLVAIYSKAIGDYVVKSYNAKIEFLANHTVQNSNLPKH